MKNKKVFFRFFSVLVCLFLSITTTSFAKTSNNKPTNNLVNETLKNIEVIKDDSSSMKTKATYSTGRVEYVIIDKINNKTIVTDSQGTKLDEYISSDIISISTSSDLDTKNSETNATKSDSNKISIYDAGNWVVKYSSPRTTIEADYKRASAVVSLGMMVMRIPYPAAYEVFSNMYTALTGQDLPSVFGYLAKKWEYSSTSYVDLYNSSNGKVVYNYWWGGVWQGYKTGYFTYA